MSCPGLALALALGPALRASRFRAAGAAYALVALPRLARSSLVAAAADVALAVAKVPYVAVAPRVRCLAAPEAKTAAAGPCLALLLFSARVGVGAVVARVVR